MKKKILKWILDVFLLTLSGFLYALGFCCFFEYNGISTGGVTGIAQVLNFLIPVLPIGVTTIVLNIPAFLVGFKLQGVKLLLSSLYCMVIGSAFVDLFNYFYAFQPMQDLLLAAVFGGLIFGVSSGISLRVGATNGGTELTARLLKYKFHHISVGKLCLIVDLCVVAVWTIVFRNVYSALYSMIALYILSIAMDFVVYGGKQSKLAYIISNEGDTIKKALLDLNVGLTLIDSHGGWKNDNKHMILCVVRRRQITMIKKTVNDIDPLAFVIVTDVHEVLGEGFSTYSPDEL